MIGMVAALAATILALWIMSVLHERANLRNQVEDLEHQVMVQEQVIEDKVAAISALELEAVDARKAHEANDEIEKSIAEAPGGDPVPAVVLDTLDRLRDVAVD